MILATCFADDNMKTSQKLCVSSSLKYGADGCRVYGPADLDTEFLGRNKAIMCQPRGCGYWLWKPYIIANTMAGMSDGDILVYADSGVEFIAPLRHIISRMDEEFFFFSNNHPHFRWCKSKVLDAMVQ